MGETDVIKVKVDDVVYNLWGMKEPDYVMRLGCIFWRNSGTFLLYPEELCFLIPPENGKGTKRNSKGTPYLPALQLIYIRIPYVGLP